MTFRKRRDALRSILSGSTCVGPGWVYDAISIRIAEDLGFEVGMFGGSVASLPVLGDPDIPLITLTQLPDQRARGRGRQDEGRAGRARRSIACHRGPHGGCVRLRSRGRDRARPGL